MSRPGNAGTVLREWRVRRRFSQMDLALHANVSTKHLSYVETGRARPSPEMILHLCEHLDVPLRERNTILLAAGHAPRYHHGTYDSPTNTAVRDVVDMVLAAHRYPAIVVDGQWNLVSANDPANLFLDNIDVELLTPPINVIRLSLHERGLAPRVANFTEYASHILARVRRLVAHTPDPVLEGLLAEFAHLDTATSMGTDGIVLPLELRTPNGVIKMFSTITTFGSPRDVTLSELAIETFYPADTMGAALLESS